MAQKIKLSVKNQFKQAVSYIKETKNYILFSIFLFIGSSAVGYFFRANLTFLNDFLKDLILRTEGLNTFEMIFFILQNNLQSALISVLAGVFFGVFPIGNAAINGTVLGYVLGIAADVEGFATWWRLLPHGLFELPAILISIAMGIKLGFSFFQNGENRSETFKERFYNSANAFLMIVIPLLIIAAFVEGILITFFG